MVALQRCVTLPPPPISSPRSLQVPTLFRQTLWLWHVDVGIELRRHYWTCLTLVVVISTSPTFTAHATLSLTLAS